MLNSYETKRIQLGFLTLNNKKNLTFYAVLAGVETSVSFNTNYTVAAVLLILSLSLKVYVTIPH